MFRGSNLANIYDWRGNSYNSKGEYDRAISDLNEAIRLVAAAYNQRGNSYYGKDDYDRDLMSGTPRGT